MIKYRGLLLFTANDAKQAIKDRIKRVDSAVDAGYRYLHVLNHIPPTGIDNKGAVYWALELKQAKDRDYYDQLTWEFDLYDWLAEEDERLKQGRRRAERNERSEVETSESRSAANERKTSEASYIPAYHSFKS